MERWQQNKSQGEASTKCSKGCGTRPLQQPLLGLQLTSLQTVLMSGTNCEFMTTTPYTNVPAMPAQSMAWDRKRAADGIHGPGVLARSILLISHCGQPRARMNADCALYGVPAAFPCQHASLQGLYSIYLYIVFSCHLFLQHSFCFAVSWLSARRTCDSEGDARTD